MASRSPRRTFVTPFVLTLATVPGCLVSSAPPPQQTAQAPYATPQNPNTRPPHEHPNTPPPNPNTPPRAQPEPAKPPIVVANPPRPQPEPAKPPIVVANPPRPQPEPVKPPVVIANPPPPTGPTPSEPKPMEQPAAATEHHWVIARTGSTCRATDTDACRAKTAPGRACTPPQVTYPCPDGLADGGTLNLVQHAGQRECYAVSAMPQCQPKATCNPPPPRKLACP